METTKTVNQTNTKTALALGGGGSRGSYEVGVCKALDENGFSFDIVTGTSIGAICGAFYVSGQMDDLARWLVQCRQDMVAENLFMFPDQYHTEPLEGQPITAFLDLFTNNGPSIAPLRTLMENLLDFEAFKNSPKDYACLAMDASTGEKRIWTKAEMTDKQQAIDMILSSTAYFPAFDLVRINDVPYLDGGYYTGNQAVPAIELGAHDYVAVALDDPGLPSNFEGEKLLIRPILRLKYYLDFNGEDLKPQVAQGYLETLKYLGKAPGYIYTFFPEDWEHMMHLEELAMGFLVKEGRISLLEDMKPVMDEIYRFLLGYVPEPLKNKYSEGYVFGRILEVMGLIAGISPYDQIHFKDFIRQMLEGFTKFTSDPNHVAAPAMYDQMEMKGLKDFMVFFHSALVSYDGHLPEAFKVFEIKDYILPYYLAWGWYLIDKFQLVFYL